MSFLFLSCVTNQACYLFIYLLTEKACTPFQRQNTFKSINIFKYSIPVISHTGYWFRKKIINWTFQNMLIKQRISMINYQNWPEVYFYRWDILIHPQKTSRKSRCVTPHICWRMCVPPHGASSDGGGSLYITALLLPR